MDKKEPTALADRKAQERTKQDSGNTEEEKVIVRVQDKFRRSQTEKGWNQYTFLDGYELSNRVVLGKWKQKIILLYLSFGKMHLCPVETSFNPLGFLFIMWALLYRLISKSV